MALAHPRHPRPTASRNVRHRPGRPRLRLSLAALALLAAACGGDSSVDPVEVRNLILTVEPTTLYIAEGQDGRLHARLVDDAGKSVPTHDLSWRSSDPSVVRVDEAGVVTGVAAGSVLVTASANGRKTDANVKVRGKGRLDLLIEAGSGQTGPVGETLPDPLVVRVQDQSGAGVPGVEVDWKTKGGSGSTSAPSTTTNQNGLTQVLWTLGPTTGSQTAQAQIKGAGTVEFQASATVGSPASVTVSPESATLEVGKGQRFTASAQDRFGNPVEVASFTWSSTAADVVDVDENGMGSALSPGTATVEAWAGGTSGGASVEVTGEVAPALPGTVTDLAVRSTTESTATLGFTQVGDGASSPADYEVRFAQSPMEYRWDSAVPVTGGSCTAPVEGTGIGEELTCSVEGLAESTAYDFVVVAFSGSTAGELSNVATGTTESSTEPAVSSVTADIEAHTFTALGQSLQVTATAFDEAGTPVPEVGFNWLSSDPLIASVDDMGLVIANAVGTANIVVSALCCAPADTVAITVTQVPATLEVSPATFSLDVNQSQQLTATVLDAESNVMEGLDVGWSSSDPAVASVDPTGLVTGVATGTAVIEARVGAGAAAVSSAEASGDLVASASGTVQTSGRGTGPYFQDTFESGDLSGSSGGFSWSSPNRTDVRNMMVDVGVPAHSGDNALRFRYPAAADGSDSFAEQRFQLGGSYNEIWFEYWLYVPDNFVHRDQSGAENNKFMQIYDGDVSGSKQFHLTLEFERNSDGTSRFKRFLSRSRGLFPPPTSTALDQQDYWPDSSYDSQEINWLPTDFISKPGGLDYTGKYIRIGEWNKVRVHFRSASCYECFDGYASVHVNGSLAKELTWNFWGQDSYENSKEARATAGYLMGWANSGYTRETKFWLDDFKVWKTDPGWE